MTEDQLRFDLGSPINLLARDSSLAQPAPRQDNGRTCSGCRHLIQIPRTTAYRCRVIQLGRETVTAPHSPACARYEFEPRSEHVPNAFKTEGAEPG